METYIAILRGINVSGQKLMAMKELQALFEKLGFQQVRTYIQSGNVLFDTEAKDKKALARQIEEKIAEQYPFRVPVIIRRAAELKAIAERHPFLCSEADKLHITFLADKPQQGPIDQIAGQQYEPDQYHIDEEEVFLYCPQGYGRTKLNNTFFEKRLGVRATTRNLKTVKQLIGIAEAGS